MAKILFVKTTEDDSGILSIAVHEPMYDGTIVSIGHDGPHSDIEIKLKAEDARKLVRTIVQSIWTYK